MKKILLAIALVALASSHTAYASILGAQQGGTGVGGTNPWIINSLISSGATSAGPFQATGTPALTVGYLIATSTTATSTFAGGLEVGNTATGIDIYGILGKLSIATSSPYAPLSVNGLVAASRFNADSAATSTFQGGLDAARVCITNTTICLPTTGSLGTVTSVGVTVPSFLTITSGSPVTGAGTIAIGYSGTALPIANGGTNATTFSIARTPVVFDGTRLVATTTDPLYVGSVFASSTATSTYAGGIDAARVCITGTTNCLGSGSSSGGLKGSFASSTNGTAAVNLTPPYWTTSVNSGDVLFIWAGCSTTLNSATTFIDLDVGLGGATTTTYISRKQTAANEVTLFSKYTAGSTGTLSIALDQSSDNTTLASCFSTNVMVQRF